MNAMRYIDLVLNEAVDINVAREKIRAAMLKAGIDLNKKVSYFGQGMTLDQAISKFDKDDIRDARRMIADKKAGLPMASEKMVKNESSRKVDPIIMKLVNKYAKGNFRVEILNLLEKNDWDVEMAWKTARDAADEVGGDHNKKMFFIMNSIIFGD